jgi:uncharacterized protein YlxP (DUF503 family)
VIILVGEVQLYLPESRSLKDKRQVLKSLKDRLHNRFNLSVAEVDFSELWQRSTVAFAIVSNGIDHADQVISKAIRYIEEEGRVQVLDASVEER